MPLRPCGPKDHALTSHSFLPIFSLSLILSMTFSLPPSEESWAALPSEDPPAFLAVLARVSSRSGMSAGMLKKMGEGRKQTVRLTLSAGYTGLFLSRLGVVGHDLALTPVLLA